MNTLQNKLAIDPKRVAELNALLTTPEMPVIDELMRLIERLGGPDALNAQAREARKLPNLMARLREMNSPYLADLDWLVKQRDSGAFVTMKEYCARVQGAAPVAVDNTNAVTLEISALQFFPWLIEEAKQAIAKRELMPGRFIRVRTMAEQVKDDGDTLAIAAAMQIVGASYVETLDTKGTDGSNVHLGGPATITGYFGGIGSPNHYPLKWAEEFLGYYRDYGITQVLNTNPGTILLGYLLHKLGIDIEFKISVFMGNDNPFAALWTLAGARLFAREDGTTSLIGFNFSNSVNNETIRQASAFRKALGLEEVVRFEHHITETYKSIVRQPYNRRAELVELARSVPNISAKHEGGEVETEATREHPSDILDYFVPKKDILAGGLMAPMMRNYIDKHDSVNLTAEALIRAGLGVVAAQNLHK